jgi:hypothetical protein
MNDKWRRNFSKKKAAHYKAKEWGMNQQFELLDIGAIIGRIGI